MHGENTINAALRRLGFKRTVTVHGFCSAVSLIVNERGLWNLDAIERQLAHVEKTACAGPTPEPTIGMNVCK